MQTSLFRLMSWLLALLCCSMAASAQSSSDFTQGVAVSGDRATLWFKSNVNTSWVDVHYQHNGGGQQNLRMGYNGATGRFEQAVLAPVATGHTLGYFFTYNNGVPAYDSARFTYTVGSSNPGNPGNPGNPPPGGGEWNGYTTFNIVNQTGGRWPDDQVYWAIIGKDWGTGRFVYVDAGGTLRPMELGHNGALVKNGESYTNYFHSLARVRSVTIPAINSARILFSVGSPMYIKVVMDANGNLGYAGANLQNPTDPNRDVIFDFGEMAILPKGHASQGIFVNTTRVDQFGFPLRLRVQGLNGYDRTVGEPLTDSRDQLFARFQSEVPGPFKSLAQGPYAPYRIIAPAHATFAPGQANGNYLQGYIDQVWQRYRNEDLVFTLANHGTFRGRVMGDRFVFTGGNLNGTYYINSKPNTAMVLLGNGVLSDASGGPTNVDVQLQIQAQICAALNRHVLEQPGNWYNQSAHHPAGQPGNWFSKFWHDHSIDRLAYGFAYDDVGDFSPSLHTTAPTTVTYTIGW